jgi:phage FluMu protein Com
MGRQNPDRLFGGRISAAKMRADSAKKEAAEKLKEAAAETCQAWNYRMIGFGGPVQPSPTISEAISGGFYFLEVKCRRCSTHSIIDLTAVNEVRRKPETPIWKLEASLRCRHCSETLRGRRPAANIVRLRKEKTLEFEAWYPEDER